MSSNKKMVQGFYIQIPNLTTEKKQKQTDSKLFEKQCKNLAFWYAN